MHFATYALPVFAALSQAKNIDIVVGKNGLTFEPNSTTAAQGDTLTFKFWPRAHSVVQGAFNTPCTPSDTGFNSDFVPVEQGAANRTFVVTVNNTDPIWFYCSQGRHCQSGMVGVVNPPASGRTLEQYNTAAAKVQQAETPNGIRGGVFMAAASGSSSTPSSSSPTPKSSAGAAASIMGQGASLAGLVAVVAGVWGL